VKIRTAAAAKQRRASQKVGAEVFMV